MPFVAAVGLSPEIVFFAAPTMQAEVRTPDLQPSLRKLSWSSESPGAFPQ
jgi:hypothetical protein